jgi:hypothetical protein
LIRRIAMSNEAVIRFHGDQYRYDYTVTAAEKQALRNVLRAYEVLSSAGN